MNRKLVGVVLGLLVVTLTLVSGGHVRAAATSAIDVPATSDIFAADLASVPAFPGGGGTLPPGMAVTSGSVITVSASGSIDCGGGAPSGPDGSTGGGTVSIQSYGGISGADIPGGPVCGLALAGVFTGAIPPADPAPARLSFVSPPGTSFTTLTPVLNQSFFIGDGWTQAGKGIKQTFVVPQGATTLWLGFQDGQSYTSPPGYYGDDTGSVSVSATVLSTLPRVVVPAVASINSDAKLQLDMTNDGKYPFCGQSGSGCKPGWASTASYAYFAKATTFALKLKNRTTGAHCDSTNTHAAQVTPIQPAGSDPIGRRVAFDANCGKTSSPDYTGIVADLFVMDSSFRHIYSASPGGGFQGTDHLVRTLEVYAGLNKFGCVTGKALKAANELLSIKDFAELAAKIKSEEFAQKLAEIGAEDFADLATKPVPGTSSCAAERIFTQAAAAINAEAIAARHNGTALSLNDQITLNGMHSNYQLLVADPAGIGPQEGSAFTVVNVTGSEEDVMLVRAILAGLARTS
jgi:hypothetical protein